MIFEIKLPDLGEGVVEGEIVKILVSKGEAVSLDQPLMEVMTDKASMEIPSAKEGVVHELKAEPGDRIAVGQTVMTLQLASRDEEGARAEHGASEKSASSRESAKKTSLPENLAKKEPAGAAQNKGRGGPVSGESASGEPAAGFGPSGKPGASPVGAAEARPVEPRPAADRLSEARPAANRISADRLSADRATGARPVANRIAAKTSSDKKAGRPLAAPFVRKLAEDLNISLPDVSARSGDGKILKSDLIRHIKNMLESGSKAPSGRQSAAAGAPPPLDSIPTEAGDRRELLTGIKRAMKESMTRSLAVPHFTVLERAEASRLIKLKEELKPRLLQQNLKITYLPFIMKAAALCLKKFPVINSCYDEKSGEIVYKKSLNVSFAADTDRGLKAPVIHGAGEKSVLELAQAIQNLASAARSHKITREQLSGGTFTVTNLGSIGGIAGTPVITPPQAAVLGVYRIERQLQMREGKPAEIPFMNLSLTCDHRLIDGATAARFLKDLRLKTEDPGLLLWGD